MAAAVFQAAAGAVTSRPSKSALCAQPLLKSNVKVPIAFVKFLPTGFPSSSLSSFLVPSHRAKDLPWAAGNSESSLKNLRVSAITEVAETAATALRLDSDAASRGSSASSVEAAPQPRTFEGITTEEDLLNGIRYEVEAKQLPPRASAGMVELYCNYRDAVLSSGVENARETAIQIMATVLDRIILQFEDPFTFSNYHKRMLEPYDYYTFGQNYIRPLIDYRNSYLGNIEVLDEIESYLKQGHNVFLFANHQTEADPAVMALLLEQSHPHLAENLTYIAGDRVVLDPFCKPFSMGRNLLCVYSKKHINDVPELADMKQRANTRTLKEMTAILKKGGQLIWIAPSGGRDRPDPVTDDWVPAAFDATSVENMRRLLGHMPVPGHMYPMSLLCHDIMAPPRKVEKELGEKRLVGYSAVGLAVASELDFKTITDITTTKQEAKEMFSSTIFEIVKKHYAVLKRAIYANEGLAAASPTMHLSQPWFDSQNANH
ncbi:unnamed protein product [Calypogeia fissa]